MDLLTTKMEAIDLLSRYEYNDDCSYNATEDGMYEIFNEWMSQKESILKAFEKHPNYNGRGQIVLTEEYAREIHRYAILQNLREISKMIFDNALNGNLSGGEENLLAAELYGFLYDTTEGCNTDIWFTTVNENFKLKYETYDVLKETVSVQEGQKVSRIMRKLFVKLGLDKEPNFEKYYARFSDAINPLKVTRYTILSVNPIDYWTMSFGNSWASCHTIDKTNLRENGDNNHQGCYSGGTESYMLDPSSIVVYTVDKSDDISKPELCDKITRCMFHIGEEKIVQGRLYPQTNDGDTGSYKQLREIVQRVISEIWDVPNYWTNEKGTSACTRVIDTQGVHYRDYEHFDTCNVSFLKKEEKNYKLIRVGANPICPECGGEHRNSDCILCDDCCDYLICDDCGCRVSRRDCLEIGEDVYCDSYCAERAGWVWSEHQEEWLWRENCYYDDYENDYFDDEYDLVITVDGNYYMSQENAENAGYAYVESNAEWYRQDDVYYCSECGKYFLPEDFDCDHNCCYDCAPEESEEDEDEE